jgi:hypothetical protein
MSFPLSFQKFEAIPLARDPSKVLIQWELKPTKISLADYEFYIDRGDSPSQIPAFQHVTIDGQPWNTPSPTTTSDNDRQIAGPISALDFYQYLDRSTLLRNFHKLYYYRIRIRKISTQEELGTPAFSWQGDLDLVGLYVVDEHNFLLEDTVGTPCLVYPRKRNGVTCSKCFDPIQKKRTNSYCLTCFGTNWEGGFYQPLDSFIDFNPSPDNTVIQQWGETQTNETNILMSNYPLVVNGDVIRELRENRMWRVAKTQHTEKRRTPMLQFVRVIEINPGDVEYKIPIDEEFMKAKIAQFEEMRKLREF